jgi:hypothetical protein
MGPFEVILLLDERLNPTINKLRFLMDEHVPGLFTIEDERTRDGLYELFDETIREAIAAYDDVYKQVNDAHEAQRKNKEAAGSAS